MPPPYRPLTAFGWHHARLSLLISLLAVPISALGLLNFARVKRSESHLHFLLLVLFAGELAFETFDIFAAGKHFLDQSWLNQTTCDVEGSVLSVLAEAEVWVTALIAVERSTVVVFRQDLGRKFYSNAVTGIYGFLIACVAVLASRGMTLGTSPLFCLQDYRPIEPVKQVINVLTGYIAMAICGSAILAGYLLVWLSARNPPLMPERVKPGWRKEVQRSWQVGVVACAYLGTWSPYMACVLYEMTTANAVEPAWVMMVGELLARAIGAVSPLVLLCVDKELRDGMWEMVGLRRVGSTKRAKEQTAESLLGRPVRKSTHFD